MSFALTDELITIIAKKQKVPKDTIKVVQQFFESSFLSKDKHACTAQYLAHLTRSMESILREKYGNPFFRIIIEALPADDENLGVGTAKYEKKRCFTVYYHPRMEPKQLRICLAHELGHLFLTAILDKSDPQQFQSEPISSVFGILAILDKNKFYKEDCRQFIHKSAKAVIDDFSLLANRTKEKFNTS